jgi:hypothetical protein
MHNLQQQQRCGFTPISGCRLFIACAQDSSSNSGMHRDSPLEAHSLAAGCVMAVMARNGPQQQRSILHTVCEGPNDIQ